MKKDRLRRAILYLCVFISAIWVIHPFVLMAFYSFVPDKDIFSRTLVFPSSFTLDGYFWVLGLPMSPDNPFKGTSGSINFYKAAMNSLIPAFIAGIAVVVITIFSGYSLARYGHNRVVRYLGILYLAKQFLPWVLFMTPYYIMFATFRLIDNFISLIVVYIGSNLPWSVWMISAFVSEIPVDLEEAALVDGCNTRQMVLKILLPMIAPGLVAVFLFAFTNVWNAYLIPLILSSTIETKPLAVLIAELFTWYGRTYYSGLFALCTLTTVPVAVMFVYLQKFLIRGLSRGAVKG